MALLHGWHSTSEDAAVVAVGMVLDVVDGEDAAVVAVGMVLDVVAGVGPANTMRRRILYSGFETCFGLSTQGAGTETHLKPRFCAILKKKRGARCKRN